jgi:hypothetical protein
MGDVRYMKSHKSRDKSSSLAVEQIVKCSKLKTLAKESNEKNSYGKIVVS